VPAQVPVGGGEDVALTRAAVLGERDEARGHVARVGDGEAALRVDPQRPLDVAVDRPGRDPVHVARAEQEARVRDDGIEAPGDRVEDEPLAGPLRGDVREARRLLRVGLLLVGGAVGLPRGPDRREARDVDEARSRLDAREHRLDALDVRHAEARRVPLLVRDEAGRVEDELSIACGAAHRVRVADIAPNGLGPLVAQPPLVGLAPHERTHVVAALEQKRDEMAAEEPRRARDEDSQRGRAKTTRRVMSS
jgi:hypothetical protein